MQMHNRQLKFITENWDLWSGGGTAHWRGATGRFATAFQADALDDLKSGKFVPAFQIDNAGDLRTGKFATAFAVDGVGDLKPPFTNGVILTPDEAGGGKNVPPGNPILTVGAAHTIGTINTIGDEDFFQVTLTAGTTYEIGQYALFGGPNATHLADPYIELYGADGTTLITSADGGANTTYNQANSGFDVLLTYTPTVTGTYYVNARAFSNSPATDNGDSVGDYELFVRVQDPNDPNIYHPYYEPTEPLYAIDWGTQVNKVNQSVRNPDGNEGTRDTGNAPGTPTYGSALDIPALAAAQGVNITGKNVITIYFAKPGDVFVSNDPTQPGLPPATITAVEIQDFEYTAVWTSLGEFASVADVVYLEVQDRDHADFVYTSYQGTPGPGVSLLGSMSPPDESDEGLAQFNSGDERWNARDLAQGGFSFVTLIHEFGHGHGLAHPHDNGGHSGIMTGVEEESPFNYTTGLYELNQGVFTMMSYEDGWQSSPYGNAPTNVGYGYLGGLSPFDVAAIQDKYGVNESHNTGDNTYTLKDINAPGTYYSAIWDGGGTDKIEYIGTRNASIDLRAATLKYEPGGGGWVSYAFGIYGGFTIANGVTIENASTDAGNDTLIGNGADNILDGGAGNDFINLAFGGNDRALGGAGADAIYFGDKMNALDVVDGGGDKDVVALQGHYGLTLGGGNLFNVETLSLLTYQDARFGGAGASFFAYDLTTVNMNVAAGQTLIVNASTLVDGEYLSFNGSAETDGSFFIYAGKGLDLLTGGSGADVFFFAEDGRFGASDAVNGGGGNDILVLRGNYDLTLGAAQLTSVETITLNSAADTRFAVAGVSFSYDVTSDDANVADGATLTVNGGKLGETETMTFDGSDESDGHFRLFAGADDDSLTGGDGNDLLYGGLGADYLRGGDGNDTYQYKSAAESTGVNFDSLVDFDFRVDKIDFNFSVASWAGAVNGGQLSDATFDADLAAALDAALGANQAILFTPDSGDYSGTLFMVVDANGDGSYQAGQDYVFEVVTPVVPLDPVTTYFV